LILVFKKKPVVIIIDEITDNYSKSIINTLFSYKDNTKLVSVNFLLQVNNATISQNCINIIISFQIPLPFPQIFVIDSATYMKSVLEKF